MSRRRLLGIVVTALSLFAVSLFFYPFVLSLTPSAKAVASVPYLKFEALPIDTLTEIKEGSFSGFFYRNEEDHFLIFDAYRSPWGYFLWGKDGRAECGSIRLEAKEIHCMWGDSIYVRWNLQGEPDTWWAPNLDMTPFRVVTGGIRYGNGA